MNSLPHLPPRSFRSPLRLLPLLLFLLPLLGKAEPTPPASFQAGCQTYTFNRFTVYEAVEKTAEAGGTVVEFYPGQPLSKTDPAKMGTTLTEEQLTALKAHLAKHAVRATSLYSDIPANEDAARKLFEFAKRLGLQSLTTESIGSIETIEKLVRETNIRVGFHGHAKNPKNEAYKLWDPTFMSEFLKTRDPRIGVCADTGHWASSGVVPLDAIKTLQGRVLNLHLKDRSEIGRPTTDQIFGTGVSNIAGILEELRRQKFDGCIFVEYETNWNNSVPDVKKCLDFVRTPSAPAAFLLTPSRDPQNAFAALLPARIR